MDAIRLTFEVPGTPHRVFDSWINVADHGVFAELPLKTKGGTGAEYRLGDKIKGRYLAQDRPWRVVMTHRESDFPRDATDSRFEMHLEDVGGGRTRVTFIHRDLPTGRGPAIKERWERSYVPHMRTFFHDLLMKEAAEQTARNPEIGPPPSEPRAEPKVVRPAPLKPIQLTSVPKNARKRDRSDQARLQKEQKKERAKTPQAALIPPVVRPPGVRASQTRQAPKPALPLPVSTVAPVLAKTSSKSVKPIAAKVAVSSAAKVATPSKAAVKTDPKISKALASKTAVQASKKTIVGAKTAAKAVAKNAPAKAAAKKPLPKKPAKTPAGKAATKKPVSKKATPAKRSKR